MIDPADAEDVERLPNIARRPFLAGMRGDEQAGVARAGKHAGELAWRDGLARMN